MDCTPTSTHWYVYLVLCGLLFLTTPDSALAEEEMQATLDQHQADIDKLETLVGTISRQLMMQQFYVEEQTRSSGNSGVKQMRKVKVGTKPYHTASHVDKTIISMHNHANLDRTIGLGEIDGVLNGVEFRTRHNDYKLVMKSTNVTDDMEAMEDIPFPDVPPEVLQLENVTDQAAEMREWFKAWRDQDDSVRDYTQYFKPVLCYLEGMWTHSDQNEIKESFDSDRHHLDAKSWLDLQDKVRFSSYSGMKDSAENFAYLPTTINTVVDGVPVLVQWNYRILCHPLSEDLPLSRIGLVDDMKTRITFEYDMEQYANSRAARYQIAVTDSDKWQDKRVDYTLLDKLMGEIPGPDNYPGYVENDVNGDSVYPYDKSIEEKLNVARYHRVFRVQQMGALGLNSRYMGYSDANLYVAHTTNPHVAGLEMERCDKDDVCESWFQRWTYAIPLEVVYMTPLSNWNPYDIEYKGRAKSDLGKTVYEGPDGGKRDGSNSVNKAYNGINHKIYYQTPYEFFADELDSDPADTTGDYTYVLDREGNVRQTRATGHRIFIPEIPGIGILRQRYPVFPIYAEGSPLWKEFAAFRDTYLSPSKYEYMFTDEIPRTGDCPVTECSTEGSPPDQPPSEEQPPPEEEEEAEEPPSNVPDYVVKVMYMQASDPEYGNHRHDVYLNATQDALFEGCGEQVVESEMENGHRHTLEIKIQGTSLNDLYYWVAKCDGETRCSDGHHRKMLPY